MAFADELGYDEEEMARMAAGFGGGMFRGDTCGCVSGALMALGLRYGHCEPDDTENKAVMIAKVKEFQERFTEKFGTLECRKLVSYDFSLPGENEKAKESGVLLEKCPNFAAGAIEILEDMMKE